MNKEYHIAFLPAAKKDMVEIAAYIGQKLCNPIAAERLADKMIKAVEGLKDSPYMYPAYYPIRPLKYEYRKITVENYLIFYWVNETEKCVTVARVIYGKRNYGEIME